MIILLFKKCNKYNRIQLKGAKEKMKEKGITLIALIITIIILIILTAITIKAIWQHNIINIAAVSAEKYINAEKKEQEELDYIDKKLRGNAELGFIKEGYCSDRFTNYINISTIAKNKFDDELTYTLHWGTTKDYEEEEIVKEKPSGEEITFELKNLGNYTLYYYRVDVTDGITEVEGIEGEVRTYCPTTKCNGPFTTTTQCGKCSRIRYHYLDI